jgi:hypothetical protein
MSWGRQLVRAPRIRISKEQSMSRTMTASAAGVAGVLCVGLTLGATAQEFNDKPLQENWWPTEWGPDDKAGAVNGPHPRWCSRRSS